jgi:hypothetical protein
MEWFLVRSQPPLGNILEKENGLPKIIRSTEGQSTTTKQKQPQEKLKKSFEVKQTSEKSKVCQYQECFLTIGFTWIEESNIPLPLCVVCGDKLANTSMAPVKLKRHFSTKHQTLSRKNIDYFKRLLHEQENQASKFEKQVKVSEKAQEASFLIAELVAKTMKPHTIAESLILPACQTIVRTLFGKEAEKEVNKIPMSDNTISRRITLMSNDIESIVMEKLKKKSYFALQVDESTDISGKAQLLAFIRLWMKVILQKIFFAAKSCPRRQRGLMFLTQLLHTWSQTI